MELRHALVFLACLLFGCSNAPDEAALGRAVERHIAWQPWKVNSVSIESTSEVGNNYQYRISASLTPKEPLYVNLFSLGDTEIVKVGRTPSDAKQVSAIADAVDSSHGWDISIVFEDDPFANEGQPKQSEVVLVDTEAYQQALADAAVETEQLEKQIVALESELVVAKKSQHELSTRMQQLREDNRAVLQSLEDKGELRRQNAEDSLVEKTRHAQQKLNDELKQQLINLNAQFEAKFSAQERRYQERRKALDKALVDNDRDYTRAVRENEQSYKEDIRNLNPDSVSADEYLAYHEARKVARDKALVKLQRDHEQAREQIRVDKDNALTQHEQTMQLLREEKTATLAEARRVLSDKKELVINEHQIGLNKIQVELREQMEQQRKELMSEELQTREKLVTAQQTVKRLQHELMEAKRKLNGLYAGLEQARKLTVESRV